MQISLHQLFIEVDLVEVAIRLEDNIHIVEACDVLVATEVVKKSDLSKASFGKDPLGVDVGYFLDRAALTRSAMSSCDDATVCTLTKFLDVLILRVDDKGRVEGGERVSFYLLALHLHGC